MKQDKKHVYEAMRVCEANRKRKDRTARAKGSSSGLLLSKLTCSTFNRQLFMSY